MWQRNKCFEGLKIMSIADPNVGVCLVVFHGSQYWEPFCSVKGERNTREAPRCVFSIIEPPHLCFHVLVFVILLEAQPEKAHCCGGEKKRKNAREAEACKTFSLETKGFKALMEFFFPFFSCIKPTQVWVPHVTHTCPKI